MKKLPISLVFGVAIVAGSLGTAAKADELFSRISMDSAFSTPPNTAEKASVTQTDEPQEQGRRVLSLNELADILSSASLEPQNNDDKLLTIKFQHGQRSFPVALRLSQDFERILVEVTLTQIDPQKPLAADRLLALLDANRQLQPAFFAFASDSRQLQFCTSFPNGEAGPKMIRGLLDQLTGVAEQTAGIWDTTGKAKATSAANQTAAPVQPNNANQANAAIQPNATTQATAAIQSNEANGETSLVGRWSAARSATDAFAMQLNADGSFVLVSVKDGNQTRSTGKFTLGGGQLTLATAEGRRLAGALSNVSPANFDFTPAGSAAKLTFTKAR